jgi:hypothetical protein
LCPIDWIIERHRQNRYRTQIPLPGMTNKKTDRAAIYGTYHLFTSTGNMVSLAAVSAVLQYRTRKYLELNLDGDFSGDIQKV